MAFRNHICCQVRAPGGARWRSAEVLGLLLAGMVMSVIPSDGEQTAQSSLPAVAVHSSRVESLKLSESQGEDPIKKAPEGRSMSRLDPGYINQAVRTGDVIGMEKVLRAGVALDRWEGSGDDGLIAHCVREGMLDMAVLLLEYGADIDRLGWEGATPLHMAIAMGDSTMVEALLSAGADSNRKFVRPVSDGLLALTEKGTMQWFLKHERRLTPLMMAANNGDLKTIKALLEHGAEKYIRSGRYKLYPINFASRRSDVKAMQVMLGVDPEKEKHHIILDLSDQRLRVYDSLKEVVFSSRVSTGRTGYRTPKGEYVITDKHRSHRSTIYNVSMPYFQRLSCGAIGFHSGYVPGYPASHGCIRMPYQSAKAMFALTAAGTRVVIQD